MRTFPVTGIQSVDIGVPDLEAAERFYTQAWGLEFAERRGEAVYLRASGADAYVLGLHSREQACALWVTFTVGSRERLPQIRKAVNELGWRLFFDGARMKRPRAENVAVVEIGGAGLQECDSVLRIWFDRNGCVAALVRPDHYVYGTAASAEDTRLLVREIVLKLGEPALADQPLGRSSTQHRS